MILTSRNLLFSVQRQTDTGAAITSVSSATMVGCYPGHVPGVWKIVCLLVCLITEHKHPCLGCHYSPIPKPSSFTCVVSSSPSLSLSLLIPCGLACLLPWVCTPPGQRLKPLPYVFPVPSTMPGSWTLSVNQC